MMGAEPVIFNYTYPDIYPNSVYPSFSKVSENYAVTENASPHNTPNYGQQKSFSDYFYSIVICIAAFVICIFGALGNGAVIWLLGFRIKKNPFITYILNLAVADLGVLITLLVYMVSTVFIYSPSAMFISFFLTLLMYSASQFFVTAISIDRCVAVFFPLWYQCKRPPHLTTIMCAFIWILSILLTAISYTLESYDAEYYQCFANTVLFLPVMTIATLCLFIKFCFKAQQKRRGRLLTIVLLTLLFFLLFGFPLNVICILFYHLTSIPEYILFVAVLLACLNSSVNPVIYFLVARQRKSRRRESMKTILQKVFTEETTVTNSTVDSSCEMQK